MRRAFMPGAYKGNAIVVAHLGRVLAHLRAMYLSYQTSHWQTHGPTYYGDHLLFQRLYESVQDEIDALAEKIVGYVGGDGVDLGQQINTISDILLGFVQIPNHHQRGLQSEAQFQTIIKTAYDSIKESGSMTLGLDDWLMATASSHETNQYLLQQVLQTQVRNASRKSPTTAESYFFDNPERREMREFAHSKAVSNVPSIAGEGGGLSKSEISDEKRRARIAPPTPTDIRSQPGAKEFSTLNRYLVETEHPTDSNVPQGHDDVPKHRRIDPSGDDIILPDGSVIDPSGDDYDDSGSRLANWTFAPRR